MSPSWRDRWLVGFAPERVALVQMKHGLKPSRGVHGARRCAQATGSAWASALAALEKLLDQAARSGPIGGEANVVLSNQFVRFADVPWTPGISRERDRLALAAECFRAVHGDIVAGWQVSLDMPRYGESGIAAAVDKMLVEALREVLAKRRLHLTSLRPHLMAAFALWQPRLETGDGGFAVVEPGCVTAMFRRDQGWCGVANRRYPCEAMDEAIRALKQCVDADTLQGGSGAVALLAPAAEVVDNAGDRPLRLLVGEGPWPDDPWRTMAWSAV